MKKGLLPPPPLLLFTTIFNANASFYLLVRTAKRLGFGSQRHTVSFLARGMAPPPVWSPHSSSSRGKRKAVRTKQTTNSGEEDSGGASSKKKMNKVGW